MGERGRGKKSTSAKKQREVKWESEEEKWVVVIKETKQIEVKWESEEEKRVVVIKETKQIEVKWESEEEKKGRGH